MEGDSFLDFSPDGERFITRSYQVWNIATGLMENSLTNPYQLSQNPNVCRHAFSSDGTLFALSFKNGTILVWNMITANVIHKLVDPSIKFVEIMHLVGAVREVYSGEIIHLSFSKNGDLLFSVVGDLLKVWDLNKGEIVRTLQKEYEWAGYNPNTGTQQKILTRNKGKLVVQFAQDRSIRVWDMETGVCKHTFRGIYTSESFSDDLNIIAFFNGEAGDKKFYIGSIVTGEIETIFRCSEGAADFAVFPDQRRIAFAGHHGLEIWDGGNDIAAKPIPGYFSGGYNSQLLITDNGKYAIANGSSLLIWDLLAGKLIQNMEGSNGKIVLRPDGLHVALGNQNRVVILNPGKSLAIEVPEIPSSYHTLTMSDDGRLVVAEGNNISFFKVENGERIGALEKGYLQYHDILKLLPDNQTLVTFSSGPGSINTWDLHHPEKPEIIRETSKRNNWKQNPILISPNGQKIIGRSNHDEIIIWNIKSPHNERIIGRHSTIHHIQQMEISPDGNKVVTSTSQEGEYVSRPNFQANHEEKNEAAQNEDKPSIKAWDLATPKNEILLHEERYQSPYFCLSPDGKWCFFEHTQSNPKNPFGDYLIACKSLETEPEPKPISGYKNNTNVNSSIRQIMLTQDGKKIVVFWDEILRTWSLPDYQLKSVELPAMRYLESHLSLPKPVILPDASGVVFSQDGKSLILCDFDNMNLKEIYYTDTLVTDLFITPHGKKIVSRNSAGEIHFFSFEGIELDPLLVTAWKHKESKLFAATKLGIGCPVCRVWSEISQSDVNNVVPCPNCKQWLKVNSFVLDGDWHAIAKAWKTENKNKVFTLE